MRAVDIRVMTRIVAPMHAMCSKQTEAVPHSPVPQGILMGLAPPKQSSNALPQI